MVLTCTGNDYSEVGADNVLSYQFAIRPSPMTVFSLAPIFGGLLDFKVVEINYT